MAAIESTDEGIIAVKPSYQDPLIDTFRELMRAAQSFCIVEKEAGRITNKEYSMLFLQTMQTCIGTSAQLSKDAAEQDYKTTHFLALDKQIKEQQVKQLKVEVALKTTQKNQIEQSVYDNRLIKIEGDLADMTGMILNGGTQSVPAGLATSLTNVIAALIAIPKETVEIESSAMVVVNNITADNTISLAESATTIAVAGFVNLYANVGDNVQLTVNANTYSGTVLADRTFSINVPGSVLYANTSRVLYAKCYTQEESGGVYVSTFSKTYSISAT